MNHPIAICVNPNVNPEPNFAQEFVDLILRLTAPAPTVVIPRDNADLLPADCAAAIGFQMPAISDACRERDAGFYMIVTALDTTGDYLWGMEPRSALDPVEFTSESWRSLVAESIPSLLDDRAAAIQAPFRNVLPVEWRERITIWPARFMGTSGSSFHFIEPIGIGGTAVVSRVRDQNGKIFAAKTLSRHRFPIGLTKERFFREAQVLSQVEHPNVVRIVDQAEIADGPVIVMEDIPEGSLHERLVVGPIPEPATATRWIQEALAGVAELHGRQIVHRDLTPKNLLLRHGSIVVSDFGTVRHLDDTTLTNSADQLGSLIYIAPEQFAEPHTAQPQADVYSIGQIAFRLFTGRSPHGNTGHIHQHATQLSSDLANVLESFRSYQADARPVDAGAALSELNAVLQTEIGRRQPWMTVIEVLEQLFDPLPLMAKRLAAGKTYRPIPPSEATLLRAKIEEAVSNTILWLEDTEKRDIQLLELDDHKALAALPKDSLGVVRGPNVDVWSVIADEHSPEATSWREGSNALFVQLAEWKQELLAGDVALLPSSFRSESRGLEESYTHTILVENAWGRIQSASSSEVSRGPGSAEPKRPLGQPARHPYMQNLQWAQERYLHTVGESEQIFGPDHRVTLATRHDWAKRIGVAGAPVEAIGLYAILTADYERIHGPDHRGTLSARRQQAWWTWKAGELKKAIELYTALHAYYARVLGTKHRYTRRSATALESLGAGRADPSPP